MAGRALGSASRRIGCALTISVVAHAALVLFIQDRPGGASSLSGSPQGDAHIDARILPTASDTQAFANPTADTLPERAPARTQTPTAIATHVPGSSDESKSAPTATDAERAQNSTVTPPGIDMPFVRDATYYSMAALDTPPRLLGSAAACYPQGAVGEVAFQISINESGTVDDVVVVAIKPNGLFTGAAAEMCSRLRFTPATKGGRPVRSRVRLVVGQPAP